MDIIFNKRLEIFEKEPVIVIRNFKQLYFNDNSYNLIKKDKTEISFIVDADTLYIANTGHLDKKDWNIPKTCINTFRKNPENIIVDTKSFPCNSFTNKALCELLETELELELTVESWFHLFEVKLTDKNLIDFFNNLNIKEVYQVDPINISLTRKFTHTYPSKANLIEIVYKEIVDLIGDKEELTTLEQELAEGAVYSYQTKESSGRTLSETFSELCAYKDRLLEEFEGNDMKEIDKPQKSSDYTYQPLDPIYYRQDWTTNGTKSVSSNPVTPKEATWINDNTIYEYIKNTTKI